MDEQSNDPLNRIMQKLESLERQINAVGDRVSRLETPPPNSDVRHTQPAEKPDNLGRTAEPITSLEPTEPVRESIKPEPPLNQAEPPHERAESPDEQPLPPPLPSVTEKAVQPPSAAVHPPQPPAEQPAQAPTPQTARQQQIPPARAETKSSPSATPATATSATATTAAATPAAATPAAATGAATAATAPRIGPPGARPRPAATPKSRPGGGESLEMRIAGTWLPRAGVLVLALVLVLFAREHVQGPVGKIVGSYLLSLALIVFGLLYAKKYPRWSSPVLAGGLAFSYFATYAMGFVEPMRVLENLGVKLALLAVNLAVIFAFAQWRRSEVMAGTALVLGYLTTGIVGDDVAALWSCVALSVVAVGFLWLNRWFVSTAIAAICSYTAWLYVQRAIPGPVRAPDASFWFHFSFLSMLFAVFTTAGWVGITALQRLDKTDISDAPASLPRRRAERTLTTLVQTNLGAYIATMVWVLFTTEVYWDRAWLFFFPLAAVSAALAAAFRSVRPVQRTYLLAAAVCVAFGIMSASSPHWLPVFLAVQALGMLLAARAKSDTQTWNGVSLLLLLFAAGYALTGQHPLWTDGYWRANMEVAMPMWVCAVVAALTLAYGIVWEKGSGLVHTPRRPGTPITVTAAVPFIVAALSGVVWLAGAATVATGWRALYLGATVPAIASLAVVCRATAPLAALIIMAVASLFGPASFRHIRSDSPLWVAANWLMLSAAFATGLWLERTRQLLARGYARFMWRTVYLWAQLTLIALIANHVDQRLAMLCLGLLFAGSILVGWTARSAALAKSAALVLVPLFGFLDNSMLRQIPWTIFIVPLLLMAAAYPIGLPTWQARTGDTRPRFAGFYQALALTVAGLLAVYGLSVQPFSLDRVFMAGAFTLVFALFAVLGAFTAAVYVSVGFAGLTALFLLTGFLNEIVREYNHNVSWSAQPVWSLVGVALIVAAERVIRLGGRFVARRPKNPHAPWPSLGALKWVTVWLAIGTLVMAVVALRLVPELRQFYFTGAMVAAAFVWIVFGFWFGESVYRRSGLVLLCIGLAKGLIWDVLSLKNTVYRQISWTILGVLAIGASFLYNRFRSRVEPNANNNQD